MFLLLLTTAASALADGKVFWSETVPPRIPYQRAIILFHEGKETLVLQSRFDARGNSATNAAFGWVVPVPAVPEMASTNGWAAHGLFRRFDRASRPEPIEVLPIFFGCVGTLSTLIVLLGLLFLAIPALRPWRSRHESIFRLGFNGFLFCLILGFLLPTFFSARSDVVGVEVIRTEDIGIYEAKVIKAHDASDLLAWLNQNGFRFNAADKTVLDRYVHDGWCFVVAKIKEGTQLDEAHEKAGYLIDPIVLTFPSERAIYPLALTATIGADTDVLIYLLADQKMACAKRLPLRFAGEHRLARFADSDATSVINGFLGTWTKQTVWLTKFKGTLTSAQMQQDLVFTPAKDDRPYRSHVVTWL